MPKENELSPYVASGTRTASQIDDMLGDVHMPQSGWPLQPWLDRLRKKSIAERRGLIEEMKRFAEAKKDLDAGLIDYAIHREKFDKLPKILEEEGKRVEAQLAAETNKLMQQIKVDELQMAIKIAEHEFQLAEINEKIHQKLNPPEPKQRESKPYVDPVEREIDDILQGGGPYTRKVHDEKERLIKLRGGEDKLTDEDKRRLADAYQRAAEKENSRGR